MAVTIRKLAEPLLAEVLGVDIARPVADHDMAAIEAAFLDHHVLVFRDTPLTPPQFLAFSRRFGDLQPHKTKQYWHPEYDEIVMLTNLDKQGNIDPFGAKRGVGWHTDLCYDEVPAKATILHSQEIPTSRGDTLFANMALAYAAMPDDLKRRVEGRQASFRFGGRVELYRKALSAADQAIPAVRHPAVRTHPDTGRRSVYVNPVHTMDFADTDEAESQGLLREVFDWCGQERFQARHRWRVGDTVIWDNRCLWHSATGDFPPDQRRVLMRTTVRGTPTF